MATNESEATNSALNTSIQRAGQRLQELLGSVPGVLWNIENTLNKDGDSPVLTYERYVEEVRDCRESMGQVQHMWENACGKTLDEGVKYELSHLEQSATKLIDKISKRIAAVNCNAAANSEPEDPGQTDLPVTGYKEGCGDEFRRYYNLSSKDEAAVNGNATADSEPEVSDQADSPVTGYKEGHGEGFRSYDEPPPKDELVGNAATEPVDTDELHENWDPPGKLSSYAQGLMRAPTGNTSIHEGSQRLSYTSIKNQIEADLEQNAIEQKYQALTSARDARAANRNAVREAEEAERELKRQEEEWRREEEARRREEEARRREEEARRRQQEIQEAFTRRQVEVERARMENEEKAREQAELLQRRREELELQLRTVERNSERGSVGGSLVGKSDKLSSRAKTEAYVGSINNEETAPKHPFVPNTDHLTRLAKARQTGTIHSNNMSQGGPSTAPNFKPRQTGTMRLPMPVYSGSMDQGGSSTTPNFKPANSAPEPPLYKFAGHNDYYARFCDPSTERNMRFAMSTPHHSNSTERENDGNKNTDKVIRAMCDQMALSRLPITEPEVFTGRDPLEFPLWKKSFDTLVRHKAISDEDKLQFLSKYVSGEAKKAIRGYLLLTEGGYRRSYDLLTERYGDQFKIADSFRRRLRLWPRIGGTDSTGLREFVDFLRQCETAMTSLTALSVLDDEYESIEVAKKLPLWLGRKWAAKVATHRKEKGRYPPFGTFVEFISCEDLVANDPVTLALQGHDSSRENRKLGGKGASFAVGTSKTLSGGKDFGVCVVCEGRHSIHDCDSLKKRRFEERLRFVKDNHLCFGCLNRGHPVRECRNPIYCTICNGPHPPLLHKESDAPTTSATTCAGYSGTGSTLRKSSMIVPVYISSNNEPDNERMVYAMLDTQSDISFITEKTAQALDLKGTETKLLLSTMTSNAKTVTCRRFNSLKVRGVRNNSCLSLPTLYSRETIPANRGHIPKASMINEWPHLERMRKQLVPEMTCEIGLLLGYDCPGALEPIDIIRAPKGNMAGPFGMETELGWGIVGVIGYSANYQTDAVGFSHRILASPDSGSQVILPLKTKEIYTPQECLKLLEQDLKDPNPGEDGSSLNDRQFLSIMEKGIEIDKSGSYSLPLPFNSRKTELFDNRDLVMNRVMSLKKRLGRDPEYKKEYCAFMKDTLDRGFAEKVQQPDVSQDGEVWYIPHFGVFHKVKKKIRVVFDCSAKYRGLSLNDALLKGPDYMNSLTGILCRFREQPTAFACDIEKMFYAFQVQPADRDYLRFLWWEGGDTSKPLTTFRMRAHLFGAVSSPSCATYGLRSVAREFEGKYGSQVHDFISKNFYVDDGLQSVHGERRAQELINNTVSLCKERNIRLHKFSSNSRKVLESLPPSECAMSSEILDIGLTEPATERVLGILWDIKQDSFQFKILLDIHPTTRRKILSVTSTIFDPLGWISPFTLRARGILQQMCRDGLSWDDTVPTDILDDWKSWCREVPSLHKLSIRRCFHYDDYEFDKVVELHHFSDASSQGFGACSYLRIVDNFDRVTVHLVMAKARVTPIASTTIPRMELTGAVLATRLSAILNRELGFKNIENFFWSDSKIVLGYIANEAKRFKVYVSNRVQEIHNASDPSQWRHVDGRENPADIASRGTSAEGLVESTLWFHGPAFLHHRDLKLERNPIATIPEDDEELRRICSRVMASEAQGLNTRNFTSFSSWRALRRGVARVKAFVQGWRARTRGGIVTRSRTRQQVKNSDSRLPALGVNDLIHAEQTIFRAVQGSHFATEVALLQAEEEIPKTSCLFRLDCFLDGDGLLRVGGRLRYAHLQPELKHPILLPKGGHVSTLVIRDCHEATKHQGRGMTLNEVRARGFWVISLNQQVKKLIFNCVSCRARRGSVQGQKMADLPPDRVECGPPFTYCGVDLFGPFLVKERRSELKRYGVLFTCLVSRSVHIEMAYSLSTDHFIQALRKFLAIRGPIRLMRCDNGTNFVGANRELTQAIDHIKIDNLRAFLLRNDCDLEFRWNPPNASHMGGAWERLIRVTRGILSSLLGQHGGQLDDCSLGTFFYEATAIINCRPLSLEAVSDVHSPEPLTPNHLLTGKSKVILPPPRGSFAGRTFIVLRGGDEFSTSPIASGNGGEKNTSATFRSGTGGNAPRGT